MQTLNDAPSWLWLTHWGARLVLLLLAGLSVASVAVILERRKFYRSNAPGTEALRKATDLIRKEDWTGIRQLLAGSA
ncbi:MAG: hypothetical protein KGQ59_11080, partial [Bdellovibrionales bacterium]|nr:hypothetical protein [Bdellovibrionales bacterium]